MDLSMAASHALAFANGSLGIRTRSPPSSMPTISADRLPAVFCRSGIPFRTSAAAMRYLPNYLAIRRCQRASALLFLNILAEQIAVEFDAYQQAPNFSFCCFDQSCGQVNE